MNLAQTKLRSMHEKEMTKQKLMSLAHEVASCLRVRVRDWVRVRLFSLSLFYFIYNSFVYIFSLFSLYFLFSFFSLFQLCHVTPPSCLALSFLVVNPNNGFYSLFTFLRKRIVPCMKV